MSIEIHAGCALMLHARTSSDQGGSHDAKKAVCNLQAGADESLQAQQHNMLTPITSNNAAVWVSLSGVSTAYRHAKIG